MRTIPPENLFTIKDLKNIINGLDDSMPVLMVNPVGKGSNEYVGNSFCVGDCILADDGVAYTTEVTHIKNFVKTKGLLIYEG